MIIPPYNVDGVSMPPQISPQKYKKTEALIVHSYKEKMMFFAGQLQSLCCQKGSPSLCSCAIKNDVVEYSRSGNAGPWTCVLDSETLDWT